LGASPEHQFALLARIHVAFIDNHGGGSGMKDRCPTHLLLMTKLSTNYIVHEHLDGAVLAMLAVMGFA